MNQEELRDKIQGEIERYAESIENELDALTERVKKNGDYEKYQLELSKIGAAIWRPLWPRRGVVK